MKPFEPSKDFVARVMTEIQALEQAKKLREPLIDRWLAFLPLRLTFSAGAVLLGILNLIRLYLTIFSPLACR